MPFRIIPVFIAYFGHKALTEDFIVKKIISFIIALTLLLSMTVSVVAFAEGTCSVTINQAKLDEYMNYGQADAKLSLSEKFRLPMAWFTDEAKKAEVFVGLTDSDTIYLQYCEPNDDPKDDWAEVKAGETIDADTVGYWQFRFSVKDKDGNRAYSNVYTFYLSDTTAPTVKLTTTQEKYQTNGITVGFKYNVVNPTVTDDSSTTKTYVVQKKVAEEWVTIYDSATKTVTEGYELYVTTGGAITPLENEVTGTTAFIYRVVYYVEDAFGNETLAVDSNGDGENDCAIVLNLPTIEPVDADGEPIANKNQVWIIVFSSIAVASLIAIAVIMIVDRKKAVAKTDAE